ncbi:sulfite exporter TauE/SafE family protein [Flavobacterium filum]|uniref:sulfite exporter TauE/SafE family protein n=1 Tax=Flavobacterium TaxID=237 RepID=UPI00047CF2EA|nr:sulfite exporter TauE/SafE family protein [Flavobacterium filum]
MSVSTLLFLLLIGLLAGLLSGMVGIGGGLIMVPLLLLLGLSQHEAQGTSLAVLSVPVTLLAAINYYKEGYVDWKYAAIIAIFFVVGGYIGSKFAVQIDQKILKKIFGIALLLVAGKLLFGK